MTHKTYTSPNALRQGYTFGSSDGMASETMPVPNSFVQAMQYVNAPASRRARNRAMNATSMMMLSMYDTSNPYRSCSAAATRYSPTAALPNSKIVAG